MIEKLREYKELIAIIIFFLGGFFWLESQFPKKSDLTKNIKVLTCLLEGYMTIAQLQIRNQQLDKDIDRLNKETLEPSSSSISPVLLGIFRDKEAERNQKRQDLSSNIKKINDTLDDLAKNVCGKLS